MIQTIQALLNNDQKKLSEIVEQKTKWLKSAKGEECPHCGSSNVRTDGIDYGICNKCDSSFDF
jgi:transposase-like protein